MLCPTSRARPVCGAVPFIDMSPVPSLEVHVLGERVQPALVKRLLLLPSVRGPQLPVVDRPDHDHVAADPGVVAQRLRDRDPALFVDLVLMDARREDADQATGLGAAALEPDEVVLELGPALPPPQPDASGEVLGENDLVVGQLLPEPRRDDQTPLCVDRVTELPGERQRSPWPGATEARRRV